VVALLRTPAAHGQEVKQGRMTIMTGDQAGHDVKLRDSRSALNRTRGTQVKGTLGAV